MDYMLMDNFGNALEAFDDRDAAEKALIALINDDLDAAHEVALLAFDSRGVAVGEPVVAADLRPEMAVLLTLSDGRFRRVNGLTFSSWSAGVMRVVQPLVANAGATPQTEDPLVA